MVLVHRFSVIFSLLVIILFLDKISSSSSNVVPNEYIIQFREGTCSSVANAHLSALSATHSASEFHLKRRWTIGSDFSAYLAVIHSESLLNHISNLPEIHLVSPDEVVYVQRLKKEVDDELRIPRISQRTCATPSTSSGTWGLARISSNAAGTSYTKKYNYNTQAGQGVNAFVLDTGIRISHHEFGGRARYGANFIAPAENDTDLYGHGTEVSGVIGGATYGVAKNVNLISVKIANHLGSGSWSAMLSGIEWVISYRSNNSNTNNNTNSTTSSLPCVINLSVAGAPVQATINAAVNSAVAAGCVVAVASGNSHVDACTWSPGSATGAITAAASDVRNAWWTDSNYNGTCVSFIAPGVSIQTSTNTSDTATATVSGTSLSAPFVAGVAANYFGLHPTATPADVRSYLVSVATNNVVSGVPAGTPNRLLYQGCLS